MAYNNKIERAAVRAVEAYIDKCPKLEPIISKNDKTPFWDGDLYVYKDDQKGNKKVNFHGRVPVQVKGRSDNSTNFTISRADAETYMNDGGCLFFKVLVKDDFSTKILCAFLSKENLKNLLQDCGDCIKIQLEEAPDDPLAFQSKVYVFVTSRNKETNEKSSPKEIEDLEKGYKKISDYREKIEDEEVRYELDLYLDSIKNLKDDGTIGWRDKYLYYSRKARDLAINNLNNPDFVKHQYIFSKYLYDWKLYYLEDYYVKLLKKSLFPSLLFFSLVAIYSLVIFYKEKADYVFGSLLPLSGQACVYGDMMLRGQLMAVEDIRDEFGDSVEIVYFDTASDPQKTMGSLIYANKKGIKYFVEMVGSFMAANYIIEHDMFVLSGADTKYNLVEEGKGNFTRILPSDAAASQEIIHWMEKDGAKNVAILYVNDDWGEGLLHSALSNIEQSSLNLVGVFDMNRNQQSFSSTVAKMKEKNPDVVCLFVFPDDGGRFIKEAYRQQFTPGFYATENFTREDMVKIAQNAAVGVRMVIPSTSEENEYYKKMAQKYKAKYNEEPTIFALKGYDAVWVMYDILKKAGTTDLNSVKKLIRSGYDFTGVTGNIRFDDKGEFMFTSYDHFEYISTDNGIKIKLIQ